MAPVISYWPVRGLINPTRMLLEHVGEKYEMEIFPWQPVPGSTLDWSAQKYQLGLPFPNLPFLKDGNTILTQSEAIIRYFARKHDLVAKTEEEHQQQDVISGVLGDLRAMWGKLVYGAADFDKDKVVYRKESLSPILKQLDKYLTNKDYLVGIFRHRLTYVDFILFELLDINSILFPDLLNDFPNLKKFHTRIGDLKGVKEFLASDRMPVQMNAPIAKFGG